MFSWSVPVTFAFHLAAADAVGFVPMWLSESDVSVVQLYAGGPFLLAPVAGTVDSLRPRKLADARA